MARGQLRHTPGGTARSSGRRCQWAVRGVHGRMTPDGPGATPAYAGGHGAFKWAEVPVGGPGRAWANDAAGHCKQPPLPDPACCTCGTLYRNFHFFCNADPPELCCTLPTATYCAALGVKVHDFPGSKLLLVAFRAVFSRDPLFLFLKNFAEILISDLFLTFLFLEIRSRSRLPHLISRNLRSNFCG